MSVQEIGGSGKSGKERIQEYPGRKKQERSEGFQESLMQNLKYQGQALEQENREKTRAGMNKAEQESGEKAGYIAHRAGQEGGEKAGTGAYRVEEPAGAGSLGALAGIRVNAVARREAVRAAEVRHMNYEESDNIEIAVTEGYTLKGKLEGSHVYVEAKYDDGRLEAYQVDTGRVQAQTQHRIERFAVETAAGMKSCEPAE